MLKLTGFPLPDVGILTLTLLADATKPEQVTPEGLDKAARYLQDFYSQGIGKSLAAGVVFPNSGFVQAAFDKPEFHFKRQAWANFVLRGHQYLDLEPILQDLGKPEYRQMVLRGVEEAPPCAFTGDPAYLRVSRDMLPMINGRGVMNFSPMGDAGLPVSDVILLAIHALPLGCVITQGALLAVESDDPALMFDFVRANLENNRRFINLASVNGYEKFPNLSSYKTRLMDVLVSSFLEGEERRTETRAPSLNAYHFSNNGTSARVTIYALPSSTVMFVRDASKDEYAESWQRIKQRSWMEDKPEEEELKQKAPKLTQRYLFYEDLFDLPGNARQFLRTYFFRRPMEKFKKGDPRGEYSPFKDTDLISWKLTELFLKRMMNMEKTRIDQIRELGDSLATYIQAYDRRKFLRSLFKGGGYYNFRSQLLRAIHDYGTRAEPGSEPLVPYESYIGIFEEVEGFENTDWRLAADLLLIRIFEQLHRSGYLSKAAPDLQTDEDAEDADSN